MQEPIPVNSLYSTRVPWHGTVYRVISVVFPIYLTSKDLLAHTHLTLLYDSGPFSNSSFTYTCLLSTQSHTFTIRPLPSGIRPFRCAYCSDVIYLNKS